MNESFVSRLGLAMISAAAMLLVACGGPNSEESVAAVALPLTVPTQLSSFALLASGQLSMEDRGQVTGGNVGVAGGVVNGAHSITTGFDCQLGVGNSVIGRHMVLGTRTAAGNLFVTQLLASGATFTSQSAFSAPPAPPPIGTVTAGTAVLTVDGGQTVTRGPGNFGRVTVNGTLRLSGGTYQFQDLLLGNDGVVQPTAPSIVRVAGRVTGADRVHLLPAAPLNASALRLIVAGANDTNGGIALGNDGRVTALVVSRASFRAGDRFIGSGAIAASNIGFGFDARFAFNTGFGCNANAGCDDANSCTTDTCTDAQCLHPTLANGTACASDNDACTNDRCASGVCVHPAVPNGGACTLPNASAACSSGTCGVSSCNAGFGDCDVDPANGCETPVLNDESNCGQCGAACFVQNGVAACASGACTDAIIECFDGFDDCDLDPANGCEANLAGDASNCGQCGAACFIPNGTSVCAGGVCINQVDQCNAGFGDCDGDPTNGCETNLGATCNDCSCQFSHTCQNLHPDIVFEGSNVGRVVTLSGYATKPGTLVVSYVNGHQDTINPANSCDFTTVDPTGNPNPGEPSHFNWRLLNLTFAAQTATFPGLYPWTMNVTVIPTSEPASEQKRWPEGGLARVAVQGIAITPSGGTDVQGHAAAFETGCVNGNNASLAFNDLIAQCGSSSYVAECTFTTAPASPTSLPTQILTLVDVDGDPAQDAAGGPPQCDGVLTHSDSNGVPHTYSLGHFLWDKEPLLASTGCNYIAEAEAYYAALDADPGYQVPNNQRDTSTLGAWKTANHFEDGDVAAVYYNAADIGVGREMHCRRNDQTGARACYVTNYAPAVFAPTDPATDPDTAVNHAIDGFLAGDTGTPEKVGKVATVAMEWVVNGPVQHVPSDPTRFWVFNEHDVRVPTLQLDAEGQKPVPGVCLGCHGGGETGPHQPHQPGEAHFLDQVAHFLPFDVCSFGFSTRDGFKETDQRDAFAELNAIVLETEPSLGGQQIPPAGSNTELLYGIYGIDHNVVPAGTNPIQALVGTAPKQIETFVPPVWSAQPDYYLDVVKPYCRTCHIAQNIRVLPQPLSTLTAAADVCAAQVPRRMPHAIATTDLFWRGSGRASLVKEHDTGAMTGGTPPAAGLSCH